MPTGLAAQALTGNLVVVTHNTKHFARIDGLRVEDWYWVGGLAEAEIDGPAFCGSRCPS